MRTPSRRRTLLPSALAATLAVAACTSVQTTKPGVIGVEREQRMSVLVSEQDLVQGAAAAYAQVLSEEQKKGNLNADSGQLARVRRIAQRIIPEVDAFRPEAEGWTGRSTSSSPSS